MIKLLDVFSNHFAKAPEIMKQAASCHIPSSSLLALITFEK
jgi:hypothetical protein